MEARLLIAYSLIAAITVIGSITAVVVSRRRAARKRRLRGIKTDQAKARV